MSKHFTVNVLEQCKISPPPNTTPTTSLPLTFFDLPWLFFSQSQPLLFFEFPHPLSHFTTTTLPKLKHSLSLTLQHYYPFAGTFLPSPAEPRIICTDSNSVALTIAESNANFTYLCSNHPRDVNHFRPLVPKLASTLSHGEKELPLLAIQITIFPSSGISIGLAFHHVVADGRTINNMFKTWASCCAFGASSTFPPEALPFYDRSIVIDAKGLEEVFLKEWRKRRLEQEIVIGVEARIDLLNMVRATFIIGTNEMEKIKCFIVGRCKKKNLCKPLHLSPYVLTCAFLWAVLVKLKTQQQIVNEKVVHIVDPIHFGFIAGGITRLEFPVPKTYLGNCVGFGRSSLRTKELLGEDGIVNAAKEIGKTVKKLDASLFDEAEKWILDWGVLHGSEHHVCATWSPKLKLYEIDFGWGRAKKIEEISIDSTRAVSLLQSRDVEGGIEIGLALPKNKMDTITCHSSMFMLFNNYLMLLFYYEFC